MEHDRSDKEFYIYENINDISLVNKIEIVQYIYNTRFRNKLVEKGNGIQVKLSELSYQLISIVYDMIVKKSKENVIDI